MTHRRGPWARRWGGLALVALALAGCPRFHDGPLPGEPTDSTYAELPDGTRVRYVDEGEGPAVVLVHGFAASMDTWRTLRPELAADHRVLALDLKGFGWSERPEGDYSPLAQARLVFALMDQRGIERATLVAHSWGSSVALAMALEHPERIERIALYDAWVFEEQLPPTFVWARARGLGEIIFSTFYKQRPDDKLASAFYDPTVLSQEYVDMVETMLDRPGTVAAALAAVRGQRYAAYQERYRRIEQPTLLLWGREDPITQLQDGERLASMLPDVRMKVYPRCGHFPMHEARASSTRDLLEFLRTEPALESTAALAGEPEAIDAAHSPRADEVEPGPPPAPTPRHEPAPADGGGSEATP
ncbi:MAG: alpha/beta fold hydrolase [Myxococcales bacterium]|nr:alpha/beta fold hydrolase [Myxococcales bacterium]